MTASASAAPDTGESSKDQCSKSEVLESPYIRGAVHGAPSNAGGTFASPDKPLPTKTKCELRQLEYIRKLSMQRQMHVRKCRACDQLIECMLCRLQFQLVDSQVTCRWSRKKPREVGSVECDVPRGRQSYVGHKSCLQIEKCPTACLYRQPQQRRHRPSQSPPASKHVPPAHLELLRRAIWTCLLAKEQCKRPRILHLTALLKAITNTRNACRHTSAHKV